MEYKRIWMSYDYDFLDGLMSAIPMDSEDTKKADKEIAKLLKEGWRIISTAPVTGSRAYNERGLCGIPNMGSDMVYTFTCGIEVFLVKD